MASCTACGRPGRPYVYRGRTFDGLTACRGERLCPPCTDAELAGGVAVRFSNPANGDTDVLVIGGGDESSYPGTRFGPSLDEMRRAARRYRDSLRRARTAKRHGHPSE